MNIDVGTKVRIIEDVRDGAPAKGQIGVYEGDFELYATLFAMSDGGRPIAIDEVMIGEYAKLQSEYPEYNGEDLKPGDKRAIVHKNPRIRLEDGSVIWGVECWWEPYDQDRPLEQSEEQLEETKRILREIADYLEEEGD